MSRILFISPVRSSAKSWSFIFWRCVKLLTTDTGSVDLPDTVSGGLGTECPPSPTAEEGDNGRVIGPL